MAVPKYVDFLKELIISSCKKGSYVVFYCEARNLIPYILAKFKEEGSPYRLRGAFVERGIFAGTVWTGRSPLF